MTDISDDSAASTSVKNTPRESSAGSTLIEFPGARNAPLWRRELRERFREIQQRKACELACKEEQAAPDAAQGVANMEHDSGHTHLGLTPSTSSTPKLNPLVAAALRRIDRAHHRHATEQQQTTAISSPREVTPPEQVPVGEQPVKLVLSHEKGLSPDHTIAEAGQLKRQIEITSRHEVPIAKRLSPQSMGYPMESTEGKYQRSRLTGWVLIITVMLTAITLYLVFRWIF